MTCITFQPCNIQLDRSTSRPLSSSPRGEFRLPWGLAGRSALRSPGITANQGQPTPVRPSLSKERWHELARTPWRRGEVQSDLALLADEIAMRIFTLFGRPDVALRQSGRWVIHLDSMPVDVARLLEDYGQDLGANKRVKDRKAVETKLLSDAILLAGLSGPLTTERLRAMAKKMSPAILTLLTAANEPTEVVVELARSMAKESLLLQRAEVDSAVTALEFDLDSSARRRALCSVRPRWRCAVID